MRPASCNVLRPQALTNHNFQSRIRKNAAKFRRAIRAAELVAELLGQGPDWKAPQVRPDTQIPTLILPETCSLTLTSTQYAPIMIGMQPDFGNANRLGRLSSAAGSECMHKLPDKPGS